MTHDTTARAWLLDALQAGDRVWVVESKETEDALRYEGETAVSFELLHRTAQERDLSATRSPFAFLLTPSTSSDQFLAHESWLQHRIPAARSEFWIQTTAAFDFERLERFTWQEPSYIRMMAAHGSAIRDLAEGPRPEAFVPSLLYPGQLGFVFAAPFVGKSQLALHLARCAAQGLPPWDDCPTPTPGLVLYLSYDDTLDNLARRLKGLDWLGPGEAEYRDRLWLFGPKPKEAVDLGKARLTTEGTKGIRQALSELPANGLAVSGLILDTFAGALPPGSNENDNALMEEVCTDLAGIAAETGIWVLGLHHIAKPPREASFEAESDPTFMGRGASAIAGRARGVGLLERVSGAPHLRRLTCRSNMESGQRAWLFEVAPEDQGDTLLYWRVTTLEEAFDPAEVLLPGEWISTRELSDRLGEKHPGRGFSASGKGQAKVALLRKEWQEAGKIEVKDGPRGAKLVGILTRNQEEEDAIPF